MAARRAADLSAMMRAKQKDWENSEARQVGQNLPEGEHEGVIEDAVLGVSKNENNPRLQCVWSLKITEGKYEGRTGRKFSGLETKDNMDWFKGDLEAIDLEAPRKFNEDTLGEVLDEAIGLPILFSVRKNDEFLNIDFIERLGEAEPRGDEKEEGSEGPTAEDIETAVADEDVKACKKIAEDLGGECDPDDYKTWEEVEEVLKALLE